MSWSKLRTTFPQIANSKATPTSKRKLAFSKSQNRTTSYPANKAKRQRIGATLTEPATSIPANDGLDSDESIQYDPDYDDYCNGCHHHPSKAILPVVTCKSPNSSRVNQYDFSQRSPLCERNQNTGPEISRTPRLSLTRPKEIPRISWISLEQSFRETESEKHVLEKSIAHSDSDDNANDENFSELIQNTQSSEGSRKDPCSPKTIAAPTLRQPTWSPVRDSASFHNATASSYSRHSSSPQKKVQCRKGGYVEKFRKATNRYKSDYAFWYHAQRSEILPSGVRARIKEKVESYGRQMATIEDECGKAITIFLSENDKLSVGDEIRIELDQQCYCVYGKCFYLGSNKVMKI